MRQPAGTFDKRTAKMQGAAPLPVLLLVVSVDPDNISGWIFFSREDNIPKERRLFDLVLATAKFQTTVDIR
jgi:hypothetical protein